MAIKQRGFTLVELNLSVIFVAMLILGIAMTTIQVSRMYQKGVTIKAVNQVGRDVSEQLRRDFATASPSAINLDEVAAGRICLGSVSYLYNSAGNLNDGDDSNNIKQPNGIDSITLVRVEDQSGAYCERTGSGGPGDPFTKPNLEASDEPTELLTADVVPLAVHQLGANLYLASQSNGISQSVYHLEMTLGTNQVGTVDDDSGSATCKPPTESTANFDNCFVSEFETVVRAGEISR